MAQEYLYPTEEEENATVKRYEAFLSGKAAGYFEVEDLEDIVDYYLARGREKDCAEVLKLGFRLHPNSCELHIKRVRTCIATGDYRNAIKVLDALTEKDDLEALYLRMVVLMRIGRKREALMLAHRYFDMASEDDKCDACYDIAGIFIYQSHFTDALKWLKKGYAINSENLDLLTEMAVCYEQTRQYDECINIYNQIIDIDPYSGSAWFSLGQIYYTQEKYADALRAFDFAHTIDEKDSFVCLQKANTHFELEEYNKAIETYQVYGELTDDRWQTNLFIAECYENMEQYEDAILHYFQSLKLYPDNYESLTGIGICLLETEKYKESVEYFSRALNLESDSAECWVYLAEALLGAEDEKTALFAYFKSLLIEPNQPETLMSIANIYMDLEKYADALEFYKEAFELDKDIEFIYFFIAIALLKLGEIDLGKKYLDTAIALSEDALPRFIDLCPELQEFID